MTQICEGVKTRQQVIEETLDEFREIYIKTKQGFNTFADVSARNDNESCITSRMC